MASIAMVMFTSESTAVKSATISYLIRPLLCYCVKHEFYWESNTGTRVALSAQTDEPGSSIAKDLIDSEDPKHTLFCRETAFVAIYALFQG